MAYDSGVVNPDGTHTFTGPDGSATVQASPLSDAFMSTLQRRQAQSAPMAAATPMGGPDLMGIVRQQQAAPPPSVADVRPSMAEARADPLAALAQSGKAPDISSGVPLPGAGPRTVEAPPSAVKPGAAPGRILMAPGAGAGAPSGGGPTSFSDAAADMYARAAMAPGGGGGYVKGGKFQTGEHVSQSREGPSDERISGYTGQVEQARMAGREADQARAAYDADVEGHMGFARYIEQGKDNLLAERKKESLDGLQQQRVDLDKEISETKIDPERFWGTKEAPSRLGFMIGAALAGAFSGYGGGRENPVLDVVNKRVAADVDAQIRNIGTKKERQSELGRIYMQAKDRWGDEEIARGVARAAALTDAEKTARAQAAGSASEMVRANAEKFLSDVALEKEKIWFDASQKMENKLDQTFKVTQGHMTGGGLTLEKRAQLLAKGGEQQALAQKYAAGPDGKPVQTVSIGGETYAIPNATDAEASKLRTTARLLGAFNEDVADLKDLRSKGLERIAPSAAQKAIQNRLAASMSNLQDMGVLQGNEREEYQRILSDWRSGGEALDGMHKFANRMGKGILQQAGAKPVGVTK